MLQFFDGKGIKHLLSRLLLKHLLLVKFTKFNQIITKLCDNILSFIK